MTARRGCATVRRMAKRPRIIVLQPFYTVDAPFDVRLFGIQCWIADALPALQLEVGSSVNRVEGSDTFVHVTMPTDGELRATLVENEAAYGLLTIFEADGQTPRIRVARLVEVQRGRPLRTLERCAFDGETAHLPLAGVEIVRRVAARLGRKVQPVTWQQAFGTDDLALADRYLTALGIYAMAEQGIAVIQPEVALAGLVAAIEGRVGAAIGFFPNFIECCRRWRLVDEVHMIVAASAAVAALGEAPAAWIPTFSKLGLPTSRDLN